MTDAVREAFERWMSEDWKWPDAVARRYGHYVLAQTESAWKAWQAALSEQPAHPAPVERVARQLVSVSSIDIERMLQECVPGGSVCDPQQVADAIRRYCDAWQPVERVQLSDEQIAKIALAQDRAEFGWALRFARAVIAEHERANGIGTSAEVCRASQVGPDKWVCDCGGPPCIPSGIGKGEQA